MRLAALLLLIASLAVFGGCRSRQMPAPTTIPAVNAPFVASPGREAFHKPACGWAKKISQPTGYPTRDAAIADGKRPCKVCCP